MQLYISSSGVWTVNVFVTYMIPQIGLSKLSAKYDVSINQEERYLTKQEIIKHVTETDALIPLLADTIDKDIIESGTKLKVIANYAAG